MNLKKAAILITAVMILFTAIYNPQVQAATKNHKKTYEVFEFMGGYAKDTFSWEVENGKVVSSSASQSSKAVFLIYDVNKNGIKRTAKTDSYHEYTADYSISVIGKITSSILKLVNAKNPIGKAIVDTASGIFGAKKITAVYRLNNDGTLKVVSVKY